MKLILPKINFGIIFLQIEQEKSLDFNLIISSQFKPLIQTQRGKMEQRRGKWPKQIKDQAPNKKEVCAMQFKFSQLKHMYIGSLVCWGICKNQFHTNGQLWELKDLSNIYSETLRLGMTGDDIEVHVPFSQFFSAISNKTRLGTIKYLCQVDKPKNAKEKEDDSDEEENKNLKNQLDKSKSKKEMKAIKQKLFENQKKKNKKKFQAKKIVAIRIEVYVNRAIFNQVTPTYCQNLQKLDNMQTLINTYKASSDQYRTLKQNINNLIEDELYYQKVARSLLLYLMEKCNMKVLNRSFIKPPPKLNYLMRQYRRLTIGLITKNKRNERRIQNKIFNWKKKFESYSLMYPCIGGFNELALQSKYYPQIPHECGLWNNAKDPFMLAMMDKETFKFRVSVGLIQRNEMVNKILKKGRKKIMEEIGAFGFEDGEQEDEDEDQNEEENEASKKSMDIDQFKLMKRNEALMEKFETENKYFKVHQTPKSMISQLKPYQGQALQWMKYRQGKIPVEELFDEKYKQQQIDDFQFERKLSPFWQEVQTIAGEKFYVNYLTGEFTKKFHDWKSIRGGILADQMGLGKTVMTLSLLADENWQGINLIVVPVAVLLQWKDEIVKHCGDTVLVYEFHADSKKRRKQKLSDYNIVLVTYSTLGHEYRAYTRRQPTQNQKFIFDYDLQRVVLDQAHNIRGTNTLQFNAVMNLKAKYSWCLTGTLIQNSQQDLFAIFKFLRVEVFSEESWWNQYIKNAGCTQAKMNVIQTVLRPIVLRRTKASTGNGGQAIIKLTQKKQFVIRPEFSKAEASIYSKLETGVRKFFRTNVQAGKSYTHVFQIISKLRQFCCHPALVFGSDAQDINENDIESALTKFLDARGKGGQQFKKEAVSTMLSGEETCVICLTEPDNENAVLTQCGHYFCEPCLKKTMSINPTCPVCRQKLNPASYVKKSDFVTDQLKDLGESSKITAILEVLQQIADRGEKCVIFTQWLKIISVLEQKLLIREMQFQTIMGGMTVQKRQKAIRRFKQKPQIKFLIVSIRAGSTGLNLAFANNVMICDPWWNPSNQDQAIGRVHRIGQTKDVNVYRFLMKNSIEEKIEKMHVNKRKLANQVMMQKGSLQDEKAPRVEELMRLLES